MSIGIDPAIEKPLTAQAPTTWQKFWFWLVIGSFIAVALTFSGVHFYKQHQAHDAKVQAINTPSSGSPDMPVSPKSKPKLASKFTANSIATKTINTMDSSGFYGLKPSEKASVNPVFKDTLTTEFELSEPVPPVPPVPPIN